MTKNITMNDSIFDEIIPRRNTASVKWDLFEEDALPLWVADMDFRVAPAIAEALRKRLDHGAIKRSQIWLKPQGKTFFKSQ